MPAVVWYLSNTGVRGVLTDVVAACLLVVLQGTP